MKNDEVPLIRPRGGSQALRQPQKRKRSRRVPTTELEQKILDTTLKTRPLDASPWSVRGLPAGCGFAHDGTPRLATP